MLQRIAAVQMSSTPDVAINLQQAKHFIIQAVQDGAELVVLPENFAFLGKDPKDKIKHKEAFGSGPIQDFLGQMAIDSNVWIVGGTIPIAVPHHEEKVYASSLAFNNKGECVARYDKIHLFDIELREHQEIHQESQTIHYGEHVSVFDTPLGKCGIAVCYDIRFPELFRTMQAKGAEIILLPAAFTVPTGKAHWEVLLRARAIENQVYIVASAQTGVHLNGRRTYGHSMIVNPWGDIKASLTKEEGVVCADIDLNFLHQLRHDFPVLLHKKIH